jgi:7,8-dihydropterin-6-yl-methyl-4-(beta-D-ribofuranosyl)aminobenzene 5'-phosphate synthase
MSSSISTVNVTIVVDDEAGEGLVAEHGLCLWVREAQRSLLLDCGQGHALASNAAALGVALNSVQDLVLSHGHYDHSGGLPEVVKRAPAVEVHCHPQANGARYSLRGGIPRPIGMPETTRATLHSLPAQRLHWVAQPVAFGPAMGITGPIPRVTDFEDTGGPFFTDKEGTHADPIDDDLALWIRTDAGLVVLVGCSHAGLINTLWHARELAECPRLHAVLGGFHLLEAGRERIERTARALAEMSPDVVIPCHCTGARAAGALQDALGSRVRAGSAGATFTFGSVARPQGGGTC